MRTFGSYLAVGILALAVGCGGSSSGTGGPDGGGSSSTGRTASNGGQCPGSSTGQSCTNESAYESCLLNACGTQYKAALGNNFASGNFAGSPCADFMNCELKCPCDTTATTCEAACFTQYAGSTSTCYTALMAVEACVVGNTTCACTQATNTNTSTATSTATGTGTSTGTGTGTGSCAALSGCCASIVAMAGGGVTVQECQAAYAAVPDATCAQTLSAYKTEGICK